MFKKNLVQTLAVLCSGLLIACQSSTPIAAPTAAPTALPTTQSTDEKTITISAGEWAPFSGEKIYQNGFVLHVIRESFAREGLQVKYDFFPWERVYESVLVKDSPYVASAYWYQSSERAAVCFYSEPIIEEEMVLFYRKENPLKNWDTLNDLKEYNIGVSLGITYPEDFNELSKSGILKTDQAPNDELNFRKLLLGRIDLFPTTVVAGLELLQSEFTQAEMDQLDYNKKPIMVSTGHLLFSKSNSAGEKYLNIFNSGLKKLRDDGTYDKMYADLLAGKYSQ